MRRLTASRDIADQSVLVLGGDGFCGWPAALRFSTLGAKITIVDNGSRRSIDVALGTRSATRIASLSDRVAAWSRLTGCTIDVQSLDLATDYSDLLDLLDTARPDTIMHFAEQRSAPFSMLSSQGARYSVDNNIRATHNVLAAMVEADIDAHLLHLGTIGVYGYSTAGLRLPEGYVRVTAHGADGREIEKEILYPGEPDSIYHLTKLLDQQLCSYYSLRNKLRITDLHQGVVWGTQTRETWQHPDLVNRFDRDAVYGTVVNRFLMQAFEGQPLTVYGSGDQTRAFIHIEDMLACIELVARTLPRREDRVRVLNQYSETGTINALAHRLREVSGARIVHLDNPRVEPEGNEFDVDRSTLRELGFKPRTFDDTLAAEYADLSNLLAPDPPDASEATRRHG